MKNTSLTILFAFCTLFSQGQTPTPCAEKPEVTKYAHIGGQWGPHCAVLALYLCQCENGEVLSQDGARFMAILKDENATVKTAHEKELTNACPELIDKIKACVYYENKQSGKTSNGGNQTKLNNAVETTKEVVQTLNKAYNYYNTIFKTMDELAEKSRQNIRARNEPRQHQFLKDYIGKDGYSLKNYVGEMANGKPNGKGKMKLIFSEFYPKDSLLYDVFFNEDLSKYHMIKGEINGEWKDGFPLAGTFSNTEKEIFDLTITFEGIEGFVTDDGILFFNKLKNADITLKNKLPDNKDSVIYFEHLNSDGNLVFRNKKNTLLNYTCIPDTDKGEGFEQVELQLMNGTNASFISRKSYIINGKNNCKDKLVDSVKITFTNGDKYHYIYGWYGSDFDRKGIYYQKNGNKLIGIHDLEKQEIDNYYSFLVVEKLINPYRLSATKSKDQLIDALLNNEVYNIKTKEMKEKFVVLSIAPKYPYGTYQFNGPWSYKHGFSPYSLVESRQSDINSVKNNVTTIYNYYPTLEDKKSKK